MSSQSDQQHSSSSPVEGANRRESENNRSRSRSREKHRRRYQYEQSRSKTGKRKHVIKVPDFSNELISFRTFLLNQAENISKEKAEKQYEAYRLKWQQKNNHAFFVQHKQDAWFQERYNPEVLDAIQRQRKQNVIASAAEFFRDFQNGKYEEINLAVQDPNKLGFICNDRQDDNDQFRDLQGDIAINSGVPVHLQTLDINASSNLNLTSPPFCAFDPDSYTLFIKAIPRIISKFDIFEIVGKLQGFKNITLSQPVKKLSFSRYCWITFKDEECLKKAESVMNGITIKEQPIAFGRSSSKTRRKIKVLKNYPISRIKIDSQVTRKLIQILDSSLQITNNPILTFPFANEKKQFDINLLYLRRVHAYDYYTSTFYFNQRSLCLKLGLAYLRLEANYEQVSNIDTVFKKFQQSAENIIYKGLNIPDHFKYLREEMEKFLIKLTAETQGTTVQQAADKAVWSCLTCAKKFRTCEFLAKHIISKHNQIKDKKIQQIMQNAYLKDPKKLTNYPMNRDERDNNKNKRPGFKRERKKDYKDLDEPDVPQYEKSTNSKKIVNFLDI